VEQASVTSLDALRDRYRCDYTMHAKYWEKTPQMACSLLDFLGI
jgi:hypothetical protein